MRKAFSLIWAFLQFSDHTEAIKMSGFCLETSVGGGMTAEIYCQQEDSPLASPQDRGAGISLQNLWLFGHLKCLALLNASTGN